jgi:hypothetical protein
MGQLPLTPEQRGWVKQYAMEHTDGYGVIGLLCIDYIRLLNEKDNKEDADGYA